MTVRNLWAGIVLVRDLNAEKERRAIDAVTVACGRDTADRFRAFLETEGGRGRADNQASDWAARCQGDR